MSERRYTDDEFALILRKATEEPHPSSKDGEAITTLAEVLRIASDAHIDPARVEEALMQVQVERPGLWERLIRTPTRYFEERRFGGEVSDAGRARLLAALRRATEHQGAVHEVLDGVEWRTTTTALSSTHARIHSAAGETRVEVLHNMREISATLVGFVGPFTGSLLGMATAASAGFGPSVATFATIVAGGLVGTAAAWSSYRRLANRDRKRIDRLMTALGAEMRDLSDEGRHTEAHRPSP